MKCQSNVFYKLCRHLSRVDYRRENGKSQIIKYDVIITETLGMKSANSWNSPLIAHLIQSRLRNVESDAVVNSFKTDFISLRQVK